jgi:hypothetical protein
MAPPFQVDDLVKALGIDAGISKSETPTPASTKPSAR